MGTSEKALIILLRFAGILMLPAVLAVLMPTSWMETLHSEMGIGEFPEAPLTEYLTRSLSAFYAVQGAILILLATDVRRFLPIIRLMGWLGVLFGIVMLGVDFFAPMPPVWTWSEGPGAALLGIVVVWLTSRVRETAHPTPPPTPT